MVCVHYHFHLGCLAPFPNARLSDLVLVLGPFPGIDTPTSSCALLQLITTALCTLKDAPSRWLLNTLKTHPRLYDNILELIDCLDLPNCTQSLVGAYILFFALCQSSDPWMSF
ncbi:hypothetical protein DSO57_1030692 [Entomophthora muscae]|uniref:Uncharacterized protein n=1 Tax=Entomophthora muscae TaxID=34485 RepID=A0ACC2TN43_9FUNG|nr:hypothetical protein DSO57_1030692 [Entomophthora muscae]